MAIAKYAYDNGFNIIVAAKDTGKSAEIRKYGFEFIDLNISRSGVNWVSELMLIRAIFKVYSRVKPDLVYHITMKPVIYGSIVARMLKIKTVNAISGLGYNFTENRRGFVQKVMIHFMKLGFNKENNIFGSPDPKNIITLKENFPGTIISMEFYLEETFLDEIEKKEWHKKDEN